jgi:hypothetical protein
MAELFGVRCTVNEAGAAADGAEGPNPVIYINLTDTGGSFTNTWFYVSEPAKREVLSVALAAINGNRQVSATIETPRPGNNPYTNIYRLYLRS